MKLNTSIWFNSKNNTVEVIDQRQLPFKEVVYSLKNLEDVAFSIKDMVVRGAPLIGVTAAYAMYLAAAQNIKLEEAYATLFATRPTAINLKWALDRQLKLANSISNKSELTKVLLEEAHKIKEEDIAMCSAIGDFGVQLIEELYAKKKSTINILTHCNAGWLATVQWGTATSPMYKAKLKNIPIHVWVDETRPRNQGARLTAWELNRADIEHSVIVDNAGGHLMQNKQVDLVLVGSDRTVSNGDVCNKVGTYLKALAAYDNNVPFYVALPSSTIDWELNSGDQIPIEEREGKEIRMMNTFQNKEVKTEFIMASTTPARNYAFDITPAKYVTGIITEKGICKANSEGLKKMFDK